MHQKKQSFKVNNSPLELEKYFKPIYLSIYMAKFQENEITKKKIFAKTN